MNANEAKQLRPGDRVLAEVEVQEVLEGSIFTKSEYVDFSEILDKSEPRKYFRAGDIVRAGSDEEYHIYEVTDSSARVEVSDGDSYEYYRVEDLELVCANADRKDKKGGKA